MPVAVNGDPQGAMKRVPQRRLVTVPGVQCRQWPTSRARVHGQKRGAGCSRLFGLCGLLSFRVQMVENVDLFSPKIGGRD